MTASYRDVLDFWFPPEDAPDFNEAKQNWFSKDSAFDTEIIERFGPTYEAAVAGTLDSWLDTAEGTLALILVLDQFPRNMFRESEKAFAADAQARQVAHHAVEKGFDKDTLWTNEHRIFFYLPFEHSEELDDQALCLKLVEDIPGAMDDQGYHFWALAHYRIIETFGRFPHRNKALGRDNTIEETAFLLQPNSGF